MRSDFQPQTKLDITSQQVRFAHLMLADLLHSPTNFAKLHFKTGLTAEACDNELAAPPIHDLLHAGDRLGNVELLTDTRVVLLRHPTVKPTSVKSNKRLRLLRIQISRRWIVNLQHLPGAFVANWINQSKTLFNLSAVARQIPRPAFLTMD